MELVYRDVVLNVLPPVRMTTTPVYGDPTDDLREPILWMTTLELSAELNDPARQ